MRILKHYSDDFEQILAKIIAPGKRWELSVQDSVVNIIREVKEQGDAAVLRHALHYGKNKVEKGEMRVPKANLAAAWESLGPSVKSALMLAHERLNEYADKEKEKGFSYVDELGMRTERRIVPIERAGIHISGGQVSFPMALLMGVIPAKVAGVSEITVCCRIDPKNPQATAIMAAAHLCKVDKFYRVGGVQAIAAMAFGTETIKRVDIIAGWGNRYEAAAKKLLLGHVGIGSFSGIGEVCILGDLSSDPEIVAADMIAQAEHGEDSRSFLITTEEALAHNVAFQIEEQLKSFTNGETIKKVLDQNGVAIVVPLMSMAVKIINSIAPEHIIVCCENEEKVALKITNVGAIFIGKQTPEALGDYIAGPNYILPTGGAARFHQALSTQTFCRAINIMRASKSALAGLGPAAIKLAELEGMSGHAAAVKNRIKKL